MSDERFSFRWGIPWLDAGFVQVPDFFFDHYVEAGVTREEFLFILHLARYRFEIPRGRARPSLVTIARQMGYKVRQVQRLRRSLEEKVLLIVTGIPGRPNDYSFENFALRLMQLHQTHDTDDTPVTHDTPTPVTHDTPPLSPTTPEAHEQHMKTTTTPAAALSKSAEERSNAAQLLEDIGVHMGLAAELSVEFDLERITSVVETVRTRAQVRDKAAWVVAALRREYFVGDVSCNSDTAERLHKTMLMCLWRRNEGLGRCPSEAMARPLLPWCEKCERAAAVLAKEDADQ